MYSCKRFRAILTSCISSELSISTRIPSYKCVPMLLAGVFLGSATFPIHYITLYLPRSDNNTYQGHHPSLDIRSQNTRSRRRRMSRDTSAAAHHQVAADGPDRAARQKSSWELLEGPRRPLSPTPSWCHRCLGCEYLRSKARARQYSDAEGSIDVSPKR